MPAAGDHQRHVGSEIGQVKHGHGVQVACLARISARDQRAACRPDQVRVAQHHALGKAGGAAGVKDAGQVVALPVGILDRPAPGNQVLVVEHARRGLAVTGIDDVAQGPGFGGHPGGGFLEGVVHDHDDGVGIVERIQDLSGAPTDIDRIQHRTGPGHRHEVFEIARRVQRIHRHAVTRGNTERAQRTGQPGNARAILGECQPLALEPHREVVGPLLQGAVQALRHVHVLSPVATGRHERPVRPYFLS
ncbi:hypothetical protein D3C81_1022760 [compost metagenome]